MCSSLLDPHKSLNQIQCYSRLLPIQISNSQKYIYSHSLIVPFGHVSHARSHRSRRLTKGFISGLTTPLMSTVSGERRGEHFEGRVRPRVGSGATAGAGGGTADRRAAAQKAPGRGLMRWPGAGTTTNKDANNSKKGAAGWPALRESKAGQGQPADSELASQHSI